MKILAGIWMDRRRAVIATLQRADLPFEASDEAVALQRIDSGIEDRTRLSGGSRTRKTPWGPQDIAVEGRQAARRKDQFRRYAKKIVHYLQDADRIVIMGPGEAKHLFRKQIQNTERKLFRRIVGVETCDKMTERQLVARVRAIDQTKVTNSAMP